MGNGAFLNTVFQLTRWLSPKTISKIVYDETQCNRLKLISRIHWWADDTGQICKDSNPYSLKWERKTEGTWKPYIYLPKNQFTKLFKYGGFFTDIESIDPQRNIATIKIAEWDAPKGGARSVDYSWREWDIRNNKEVKLTREIKYPKPFILL